MKPGFFTVARVRGMLRRTLLVVVLATVSTPVLHAAVDPHSGDPAKGRLDEAGGEVHERRTVGLWRVRASHPQRASTGLGALWTRLPEDYDCTTVCDFRGWFVHAEPGLAGGQLGLGWATVYGEKRGNPSFLSHVYLGYGLRAALLRTWGSAAVEPSDQTFVGIEGDFTIIGLSFSLGLFRPLRARESDEGWLISGGVGWGF